jgi:hypothetical protein
LVYIKLAGATAALAPFSAITEASHARTKRLGGTTQFVVKSDQLAVFFITKTARKAATELRACELRDRVTP